MIHYTETTVFNTPAQTIVNTVNCLGVMGGGIALEFKLRNPQMYLDYEQRCEQKQVKTGKPYLYTDLQHPWILNFPTKYHWRYPSKIQWIEQGLRYFMENRRQWAVESIACPQLGCGKGNLDWHDVQPLMERYLSPADIDIHICLDSERRASGIEGIMVDMLNGNPQRLWADHLNIRVDIAAKITEAIPINRFRQVAQIRGVGEQTYADLFDFFYSRASTSGPQPASPQRLQPSEPQQLRLPFDQ